MKQNKDDIKHLCDRWLVVHSAKLSNRKVKPPQGAAPVSKTGGTKRSGVQALRLPLKER
ncbi:MAG: hypothetical protein WD768_16060 [Phycisphaeraceae bacterium]